MPVSSHNQSRKRQWLVIVLLALGVHLVAFFSVKQSFFELFRKTPSEDAGASSGQSEYPGAIIAIPIHIEGEQPEIIEVSETQSEATPVPPSETQATDDSQSNDSELDNLLGQSQGPRESENEGGRAMVTPRPIEITWPKTENLGHCRELHVEVKIFVNDDGSIGEVEAIPDALPEDCVAAALEAATRIRFRPGIIRGRPTAMWTRIRIEFR